MVEEFDAYSRLEHSPMVMDFVDFDVGYDFVESHLITNWWSPLKTGEGYRQLPAPDHGSDYWSAHPNPVFGYESDYFQRYRHGFPITRTENRPSGMASVVPWLLTMSLLGFREYAESSGPTVHISQELEAPPALPHLSSLDFALPSGASFDDPSFENNEETPLPPPLHADCDFPSNHKPSNEIVHRGKDKPHGFQIDPNHVLGHQQQQHHQAVKSAGKGERNLLHQDSFENGGAHVNDIVQPSGKPSQHQVNQIAHGERFFNPGHTFKPPKESGYKDEYAGPAMHLVYSWKTMDYEFDSDAERNSLIYSGTFIPENNLPLGLEVWKDKIFVSMPRWKKGIPATLATIPIRSLDKSPKLKPYPDWRWHHLGNCQGLTSVFRMQIDECDRLWVLDSGKIDITNDPLQVCPPTIFVFDLYTDELVRAFTFPQEHIKEDSLYSNIVVDVRNGECDRAVAYAADVWRFGIVVYDFHNDSSFRVQHHFFFPDPLSSRYNLHGLEFQWTDGLFGVALTPVDVNDEKTMFFHPMSSFREFAVPVSVLRDRKLAESSPDKFVPVGKPRAKDYGHSSGSAIDRNGVMFFNMVTRDSVWCWDTRKEYIPQNLGVVGSSNVSLVFPNDIRMDHEEEQSAWILSNRLPMYLYNYMNKDEVNFRILKASAKEAVRNTVCDPNYIVPESVHQSYDSTC